MPSGANAIMTAPPSAASRNESECQHLPKTLDHHRSPCPPCVEPKGVWGRHDTNASKGAREV